MKEELRVAVIGSRGIDHADLSRYIPEEATMLISGGAMGVDTLAETYAAEKGLPIKVIKPQYELFGKRAPLLRNRRRKYSGARLHVSTAMSLRLTIRLRCHDHFSRPPARASRHRL